MNISRFLRNYNYKNIIKINYHSKSLILQLSNKIIDKHFTLKENYIYLKSKEYDDLYNNVQSNFEKTDSLRNLFSDSCNMSKCFLGKKYEGYMEEFSNVSLYLERLPSELRYFCTVQQLICQQMLIQFGNDEQKSHYLNKMMSGKYIGAFCINEINCGSNMQAMECKAVAIEDDKFIINGTKNCILYANEMDFCIVFAKLSSGNICAFIIDQPLDNSKNIQIKNVKNSLYVENVFHIEFRDFPVSSKDILGKLDCGFQIATSVVNSARFSVSSSMISLVKQAQIYLHKNNIRPDHPYSPIAHDFLYRMNCDIHSMEIPHYFTMNCADDLSVVEPQQYDLEFAALKVFSSKKCLKLLQEAKQMSKLFQLKPEYFDDLLKQAYSWEMFLGNNEVLHQFVGSAILHSHSINESSRADIARFRTHSPDDWNFMYSIGRPFLVDYIHKPQQQHKFIDACLHTVFVECISAITRHGFNLPNLHSIVANVASVYIEIYHLLVLHNYRNLFLSDPLEIKAKPDLLLKQRQVDASMSQLRASLGEELAYSLKMGQEPLSSDVNSWKYENIANIVTKSEVTGVEHPTKRNW